MIKAFLLSCVLLTGLLVAACGGDDDDSEGSSATPTGSSEATTPAGTGGEETPTDTPAPTTDETPRGDTGRECEAGRQEGVGLISYLEFESGAAFFGTGDEVAMTLVFINCAAEEQVLYYPTAQRYDFFVEDLNGEELWRWSDGQEFDQAEGEVTLAPDEAVEYQATWDQKDSDGEQVAAGTYKVYAFNLGCGTPEASDCHSGPVELIQIDE